MFCGVGDSGTKVREMESSTENSSRKARSALDGLQ
jgi:hypothetical protein